MDYQENKNSHSSFFWIGIPSPTLKLLKELTGKTGFSAVDILSESLKDFAIKVAKIEHEKIQKSPIQKSGDEKKFQVKRLK